MKYVVFALILMISLIKAKPYLDECNPNKSNGKACPRDKDKTKYFPCPHSPSKMCGSCYEKRYGQNKKECNINCIFVESNANICLDLRKYEAKNAKYGKIINSPLPNLKKKLVSSLIKQNDINEEEKLLIKEENEQAIKNHKNEEDEDKGEFSRINNNPNTKHNTQNKLEKEGEDIEDGEDLEDGKKQNEVNEQQKNQGGNMKNQPINSIHNPNTKHNTQNKLEKEGEDIEDGEDLEDGKKQNEVNEQQKNQGGNMKNHPINSIQNREEHNRNKKINLKTNFKTNNSLKNLLNLEEDKRIVLKKHINKPLRTIKYLNICNPRFSGLNFDCPRNTEYYPCPHAPTQLCGSCYNPNREELGEYSNVCKENCIFVKSDASKCRDVNEMGLDDAKNWYEKNFNKSENTVKPENYKNEKDEEEEDQEEKEGNEINDEIDSIEDIEDKLNPLIFDRDVNKKVAFIIDKSGSMKQKFSEISQMTRFEFIKRLITKYINRNPESEYVIISADEVEYFPKFDLDEECEYADANSELYNKIESLQSVSGTHFHIKKVLKILKKCKNVEKIFFLTDGGMVGDFDEDDIPEDAEVLINQFVKGGKEDEELRNIYKKKITKFYEKIDNESKKLYFLEGNEIDSTRNLRKRMKFKK